MQITKNCKLTSIDVFMGFGMSFIIKHLTPGATFITVLQLGVRC